MRRLREGGRRDIRVRTECVGLHGEVRGLLVTQVTPPLVLDDRGQRHEGSSTGESLGAQVIVEVAGLIIALRQLSGEAIGSQVSVEVAVLFTVLRRLGEPSLGPTALKARPPPGPLKNIEIAGRTATVPR